jgi:tetratricopeptide (TPR) repeat protein
MPADDPDRDDADRGLRERHEQAIAAYDEIIGRGLAPGSPDDAVEQALRGKATALGQLGRFAEVAEVAAELRERCARMGSDAEAVRAARTQGWALQHDGRVEEALLVYAEAIGAARPWAVEGEVIAAVAGAMLDQGEALASAGLLDDAVAALDDLVETYGALDDPAVDEVVVRALNDKAGVLLLAGDESGEALVVLESLVDRLDGTTEPDRGLRVQALMNLGQGFALAERFEEALEALQRFVAEFGEDPDPEIRSRVALALSNIGEILAGVMDRPEEAEATMERVLRDFGEEALAAYDAAAAQGAESLEPQRRMQRVGALYKKASMLRNLGRAAEAITVIDALELEYDGDEHPAIVQALDAALELRADIVDGDA